MAGAGIEPLASAVARLRVFISYSRSDAAAADALVEALNARGFQVTIDRRDLPFGEKWQAELAEFIRLCDTVIWLVSPASIRSDWVSWELDEVARRAKRLVPVMIGDAPRGGLPRQLGEIHILPADRMFDLGLDLDLLVEVLETDRAWLRQGSRLQDRAHEWLAKGRAASLVLQRRQLIEAELWKDTRPARAPAPAQEVLDLLLASRQAVTRRQRWWVAGSVTIAAGAVTFALYALALRSWGLANELAAISERDRATTNEARAVEQEKVAVSERNRAQEQRNIALGTTSRILARDSERALAAMDPVEALLIALEGLPATAGERPHVWQAERAAYAALFQNRHVAAMRPLPGWGDWTPVFNADGRLVLGQSEFTDRVNSAALFRADTGEMIARYAGSKGEARPAIIDDTGRRLFVNPRDGVSGLVPLDTLGLIPIAVPGTKISLAAFNASGTRLATLHDDGRALLWDSASGALLQTFEAASAVPAGLKLSADGRRVAIGDPVHGIRIYDDGVSAPICRIMDTTQVGGTWLFAPSNAHFVTARVHGPAFGTEGDERVQITALDKCTTTTLETGAPRQRIASLDIANGGALVVATLMPKGGSSKMKTLIGWDIRTGQVLHRIDGVLEMVVREDGVMMLIQEPATSGTVAIANLDGKRVALDLGGEKADIELVRFNSSGTRVAARIGTLSGYRLWNTATGAVLSRLAPDGDSGRSAMPIAFNPDGTLLLAVSTEAELPRPQLWNAETGRLVTTFDAGGSGAVGAHFSRDGARVALPGPAGEMFIASVTVTVRAPQLDAKVNWPGISANGRFVVGRQPGAAADAPALIWEAKTGQRVVLDRDEVERLDSEVAARIYRAEDRKAFGARPRLSGQAAAGKMPSSSTVATADKAYEAEATGSEIAGRELARIRSEERLKDRARHGIVDLAFLVRIDGLPEPFVWLVGNDGRVALERATEPEAQELRKWNGSSFADSSESVPESHQTITGFNLQELAISHDGASLTLIASDAGSGTDAVLRVWQKDSEQPVAETRFDLVEAPAAARFDPPGRRIVLRFDKDPGLRIVSASSLDEVARIPLSDGVAHVDISPDGSRIVTEVDEAARLWMIEPTTETLVRVARASTARCLSKRERASLSLDPAPPRWCIMGAGLENERDPAKWRPKMPYRSKAWREWLIAHDRGEKPELPQE